MRHQRITDGDLLTATVPHEAIPEPQRVRVGLAAFEKLIRLGRVAAYAARHLSGKDLFRPSLSQEEILTALRRADFMELIRIAPSGRSKGVVTNRDVRAAIQLYEPSVRICSQTYSNDEEEPWNER